MPSLRRRALLDRAGDPFEKRCRLPAATLEASGETRNLRRQLQLGTESVWLTTSLSDIQPHASLSPCVHSHRDGCTLPPLRAPESVLQANQLCVVFMTPTDPALKSGPL